MKRIKTTILLLIMFCALNVKGQIHPITGIIEAPTLRSILISVDTFSGFRFNYDSIRLDIVSDSLYFTDDIAVDLSTFTNDGYSTSGSWDDANNEIDITVSTPGSNYSIDMQGVMDSINAGGGGYWTQTGTTIYYNTGKVGIGTTAPIYTMQLHQPNSGWNMLNFTNNTTGTTWGNGSGIGLTDSEDFLINQYENLNMRLATNNATRMYIQNDGKVGIGTDSPSDLLHIFSSAAANMLFESNNNSTVKVRSVNASPSANLEFTTALVGTTSLTSGKNLGAINFKGFRDYDSDYALAASIKAITTENYSGAGVGSKITFSTAQAGFSSPAEHMVLLERGYLGVGITAPTAGIHLKSYGSGSTTDALIIENSSSTDLFHIEDGGNIGIGTATPDALLDIEDATKASLMLGDGTYNWEISQTNADGHARAKSTEDKDFRFEDSAGSAALIVSTFNGDIIPGAIRLNNGTTDKNVMKKTSSGAGIQIGSTTIADWDRIYLADDVGINIDTPTSQLQVNENSTGANTISITNDDTGETSGDGLQIGLTATEDAAINQKENNDLYLATNNTIRIHIENAGNIGVGTSAPTEMLDINSDAIRIRTAQTPASASATGTTGMIAWDANYIYVCVATNTWKRTAIDTW